MPIKGSIKCKCCIQNSTQLKLGATGENKGRVVPFILVLIFFTLWKLLKSQLKIALWSVNQAL